MKPLRTPIESEIGPRLAKVFADSGDALADRLESFPRYARRKTVTRFITLYELFKLAQPVKGSIIECGVFRGFGLMTWAHLSAVLEPANLTRRIYGFDSFSGFPAVGDKDHNAFAVAQAGGLKAEAYDELTKLIEIYDQDRFLGHINKVHLLKGDVISTIPAFAEQHPHLVVSLLFLDLDLYEPTRVALQTFVPRMPKGSIIAFDQLDNPIWPGEARALADTLGINTLALRRFDWDPYVGYAVV